MKIRRSPNAFTVYTDFLLYAFMWAMMLVSLLIISHVQAKKNEDFHPKAEYLVTLTWDDAANVDLDLWLRGPWGDKPVFYQNRETKNISLDRDSRGYYTNQSVLETGQVINTGNREIIALRAVIPGDYIVAVTYYDGKDRENNGFPVGKEVSEAKIKATIRLDKVNPAVTTFWLGDVDMTFVKQLVTVVAFHINEDGSIKILPKPEEPFLSEGGGFYRSPAQ